MGSQPLRPEKSTNYSFGAVLRGGGFDATVDVYRIDIRDRIMVSENLSGGPRQVFRITLARGARYPLTTANRLL